MFSWCVRPEPPKRNAGPACLDSFFLPPQIKRINEGWIQPVWILFVYMARTQVSLSVLIFTLSIRVGKNQTSRLRQAVENTCCRILQ